MMPNCAYCGQPLETWNDKHIWDDRMSYLKEHPEGGELYEKLGGVRTSNQKAIK